MCFRYLTSIKNCIAKIVLSSKTTFSSVSNFNDVNFSHKLSWNDDDNDETEQIMKIKA